VFFSLLDNVTPLLDIPNATEQVIYGRILLVAVSGYTVAQRTRTPRGAATAGLPGQGSRGG
jgi:ribose transport system ATP-binding protein